MASTYSTNLAIELIGTGDQAGAWGNTTNTNLGTLIEQAISGYVTQAVSTGTDTTITIPNGATGVARNMYIELTGTGGASTNLIVPANKKLYFIFNNTSSGQVTVKVSGQTGVSVPNKAKMILVSNGTDIVDATNYIGNISAASANITVLTSASATITNLIATSASITTLTNNPTFSAGTANGVLYLNGSKVATSGSALTFDGSSFLVGATSAAAGKAVIKDTASSNTLWLIGRTSDGASSVSFRNAADSAYNARLEGVSGQLIFEANGSEQMRLTSTGLGIGTSSPAYNLSIVSSGATATLNLKDSGTADGGRIRIRSQSENLEIITGGGVTATFNSAQNLGLGVTPSAWRSTDVAFQARRASLWDDNNNAMYLGQNVYENTSGNYIYIGSDYASAYRQQDGTHAWFYAASGTAGNTITFTQAMTLDASGNLGVGTSSPSNLLTINKNNADAVHLRSADTNYSSLGLGVSTSAGYTYIQSTNSGSGTIQPLTFWVGNSERARITSGGDLLVATSDSAETTGPGLKLIYSTTIPKYRVVHDTATSGETSFVSYNVNATNNGYRFYVTVGGTINAINTTISAISDQRLKENVCDLDVGLDAIMSLKPRKFDWKEGKGKDIKGDRGFIAQEFEQVFPDLVDEWKDPAPEGEEPYKSVRQDLIPVLVKAIQEQQAMINDLKAKVAALESK